MSKTSISRYASYLKTGFLPSKHYWNWNIYSNGFALSENLGLKKFTKLTIAGDHGIGFGTVSPDRERNMPGLHHLTWQEWRLGLDFGEKNAHLIKHPWVNLFTRERIELSQNRRGTLVFVPHSVPGIGSQEFNVTSFVSHVEEMIKIEPPIAYSLHWHDLGGYIHNKLIDLGKFVVTAGDTQHPLFLYKFAEMVSGFRYACSPSVGSQLFFLHHMGSKYFIIPGHEAFSRAELNNPLFFPEKLQTEVLFSMSNLESQKEDKDNLVARGLGLNGALSHTEIRQLIYSNG